MAEKYFYVHNGLTVGALTVDASTGNLQSSGVFTNTNTTQAFSTNSGAVRIAGGVGIGGGLFVGGALTATNIYGTFNGTVAGTVSSATSAAFAYKTTGTHTAGTGLTGTAFDGSANQTWSLNTATLMASSNCNLC